MVNNDPITAKKFFTGAVNPKTGLKALAFLPWIILILFLGYSIYAAWIKPRTPTQQNEIQGTGNQAVQPQAGSANVQALPNSKVEVKINEKKTFEPFGEIFAECKTDSSYLFGLRVGLRMW
jgi:hypothetical protein